MRLEARPPNIEGAGAVTIRDLVRNALRMRPDRIVVGECRGGEALDMLQAMNTGHDGSLTTVHANSPRDVISRLETMVLMSGMDLPVRAIREQIASAIDLIVHESRFSDGIAQGHAASPKSSAWKATRSRCRTSSSIDQTGVGRGRRACWATSARPARCRPSSRRWPSRGLHHRPRACSIPRQRNGMRLDPETHALCWIMPLLFALSFAGLAYVLLQRALRRRRGLLRRLRRGHGPPVRGHLPLHSAPAHRRARLGPRRRRCSCSCSC